MDVLIKLFIMCAKLSCFSFGGGYVMIPLMLGELQSNSLINSGNITNVIAIAGFSPGPVAVNAAVGLGYAVASFPGSLFAFMGMFLPNIIIVIVAALFFSKIYHYEYVQAAFGGLRPVVTGIVLYAALSLAMQNGVLNMEGSTVIPNGIQVSLFPHSMLELKSALILAITFLILIMNKKHMILVLVASGVAGIIFF
jgi:chromate transporter